MYRTFERLIYEKTIDNQKQLISLSCNYKNITTTTPFSLDFGFDDKKGLGNTEDRKKID